MPSRHHRVAVLHPAASMVFLLWTVGFGCTGVPAPPDPASSRGLDDLRQEADAVARVYAAPIPIVGTVGTHTWLVLKRAGSSDFHRWEVFIYGGGIYDYVWEDLFAPEADLGAGPAYLVAELTGPAAEAVVDFVESESANYPCQHFYRFYAGPNSNSYTQWVLDSTGWAASLPATAVGKDVPPDCH